MFGYPLETVLLLAGFAIVFVALGVLAIVLGDKR